MIEQFFPVIRDAESYIAALSVVDPNGSFTDEQVEKILEVYARYMPGLEQYALKCCFATDLLPEHSRDDAVFALLDLTEADLDGLFLVKNIVEESQSLSDGVLRNAVDFVQSDDLSEPVRVLLARIALNAAALSREFLTMRDAITSLSQFLIGCGENVLDRYTDLIVGVWLKCRK